MEPARTSTLVRPGPDSSTGPRALERAPTLMGGEIAGSHGEVQVWAPDRRGLWLSAAGLGALGAALAWLFLSPVLLLRYWAVLGYLATYVVAVGVTLATLRRPCYVTTDDAGIGITTSRSSLVLQWSDIQSARLLQGYFSAGVNPRIELARPERVRINLSGYPRSLRRQLFSRITSGAHLQPGSNPYAPYSRSPEPLPAGSGASPAALEPPVA